MGTLLPRRCALVVAVVAVVIVAFVATSMPAWATDAVSSQASLASHADGPLVVRLEETVSLPALRDVTVGAIAVLDGEGAEDAAGVSLGRGPAPERTRGVTRATVMTALLRAGFSREAIRFAGARRALVEGAGQELDRRRIDRAVRDHLDALRKEGLPPSTRVTLERFDFPRGVRIPAGGYALAIESADGLRSGANRLGLIVTIDGVPPRRVPISAEVTVEGPVVVLARDVPGRARLTQADLTLADHEWPRFGRSVARVEEALGRVARHTLRAGDVLAESDIGPAWAVMSGEVVRAIYQSGSVRLAFETTARGNAEIGGLVRVNGANGKLVQGRAIAPGEVMLLGSVARAGRGVSTVHETKTER